VLYGGEDRPLALLVPPGVVHAYRNVSRGIVGWVFNYPDRLYAGRGRNEPVDEVRHEERQDQFYRDFAGSVDSTGQ
jgi:dTDP-4-dehydrorhamnose 3,5-epimerase